MDDLISRQAAIDIVRHECGEWKGLAKEIVKQFNGLPSVQPKWIPCSERLPNNAEDVLTTYIVDGNQKKRYVESATYYTDDGNGFWSSPWDEYRVIGTRTEVIAWMPLPKPYKGGIE